MRADLEVHPVECAHGKTRKIPTRTRRSSARSAYGPAGECHRGRGIDRVGAYSDRLGDLTARPLSHLQVSGSRLDALRLADAEIEGAQLTDVIVTGCDLSSAALHRSSCTRVHFKDSKLVGVRANESSWTDVHLEDCVADVLQLQQSRCQRVRFSRCRLRGALFNGTDLHGAVFDACDLREADFSNAVLTGADLRRSSIERIRIGPEQLQVVTLTPDQALYVIDILGVTIDIYTAMQLCPALTAVERHYAGEINGLRISAIVRKYGRSYRSPSLIDPPAAGSMMP